VKKIAFLDILRCVLKKLASLDTATFSVTDWLEEEGLLNQIFRFLLLFFYYYFLCHGLAGRGGVTQPDISISPRQ